MRQDEDLKILDEMIAELGGSGAATACDLLLEHLQAARRYLLGSMPREYGMCLQQARESLASIPERVAGIETKKILRYLIDSEVPKQLRSTATSDRHPLPSPVALESAS